ncbi:hypothetical protein KC734_06190 [candidate division KSB1 bacterium]|nr:hypothetical protein [candidate division KSB1 bacterium]
MKDLLYFSFADLMVRIDYNKDANSLRYASHRKLSFGERVIVEQYLLSNIAIKTEYYKKHPALFVYLGVDVKLEKELKVFHLKNTLKTLADREKEVKTSVSKLINHSMQNFYFEKIGDTILSLRQTLKSEKAQNDADMQAYKQKLEELIDAYNLYAQKKVNIEKVLPSEIYKILGFDAH